jgi:hypothetical protein
MNTNNLKTPLNIKNNTNIQYKCYDFKHIRKTIEILKTIKKN